MYKILFLFIFFNLLAQSSFGQVIIRSDNFETTTFPSTSNWSGDTNRFAISTQNDSKRLRLNAEEGATKASIALPDSFSYGKLQFDVFFNFSGLSSSNRLNIYFGLTKKVTDGTHSGYLLQAGESGSNDVFRLFKVTNGVLTSLGADTTNVNDGGSFTVELDRDTTGTFTLSIGKGEQVETNPFLQIKDTSFTKPGFIVFESLFTSSRSTGTSFDNIIVSKYRPFLKSSAVLNETQIQTIWSDVIDNTFSSVNQFVLEPNSINPSAIQINGTALNLTFANPIPFGESTLQIEAQKDLYGILSAAQSVSISRTEIVQFEQGDILLSEFMHNPPSGLVDYVELANLSSKTLDLSNWILKDNNSTEYKVPSNSIIKPLSYVVLAADTSSLFTVFGHRNYIKLSTIPGFNNTSTDQVRIYTNAKILVDSLQYTTAWNGSGVALERRSFTLNATYRENWGPSPNNLKGTPGLQNEIEQDTDAPTVSSIQVIASDSILINTSESVLESSVQTTDFSVNNGISISTISFKSATEIVLVLSSDLQENLPYQLSILSLEDVFGNAISAPINQQIEWLVSEIANEGDILISEFMYDPPTGYTEFIELFNASSKVIDLANFTYNDNSGNRKPITTSPTIFRPNSYLILAPSTTLSATFPEARIISMGSNFAALNNSGDNIVIYSANGDQMDSLTYTSAWGGTKRSLERRSTTVSSVFIENWGDSPNDLFATLGKTNEIEQDTDPANLLSVTALFPDSLLFVFNERLNIESIQTLSNFNITGATVSGIRFENAQKSILLSLSSPLIENQLYSGSINGITDLFGNTSTTISFSVEFVQTSPAVFGDVAINEFLYDPPTAYAEFIELLNTSSKIIDLSNWTFSDNSGSPKLITDESILLKPNQFIVLTTDNSINTFFPEARVLSMASRFSSLNNSGDQIVIKNAQGLTIDSLQYSSSWGGEKTSLERRSTTVSAVYAENWGNSTASLSASPGSINTIEPDLTPPVLTQVFADSIKVTFVFSEQLDTTTALASTFTNSLNRTVKSFTVTSSLIEVEFNETLSSSTSFQVNLSPQKDLFGNESVSISETVEYVIVKQAEIGDLLITEFVIKSSDTTPEIIEIYNSSSENIDLRTLRIGDNRETISLSIRNGFKTYIQANQYLAISTDEGFSFSGQNRIAVNKLPSLNDTGSDAIVIKTTTLTLDSTNYSTTTWPSVTAGQSFERISLTESSVDPANWIVNPQNNTTAGFANTPSNSVINQGLVYAGWLHPDTLTIVSSRYITIVDSIEVKLNGMVLTPAKVQNNTVKVAFPLPIPFENSSVSFLDKSFSNSSNSTKTVAFPIDLTQVEPLIVTEIMYDPLSTQSDYVELFNPNPFSLTLSSSILKVQSLTSGSVTNLTIDSKGNPISINPESYAIILSDTSNTLSTYRLSQDFDLSEIQVFRAPRTTLSLSSSTSSVLLKTTDGILLDSVQYTADWHNPNISDTKGRSLERVLLNGPSNDNTNWSTSGNELGGTPGLINSNFIEPGEALKNQVVLFPNPFSPDEDGFEDNTTISWNLDGASYLITATIYDRYGRKVRSLAEGVVGSKTGSLVWNGKRDDGTYNRVGIYIILFKAIDNTTGKEFVKKESIVIARKL